MKYRDLNDHPAMRSGKGYEIVADNTKPEPMPLPGSAIKTRNDALRVLKTRSIVKQRGSSGD